MDLKRTLDADDLARGVAHLDDETILKTLHDRYDSKVIYSSVNKMLIAINPYEDLGLYTAQMLETYAALGGEKAPPPHAYAVAAAAFKGLLAGGSQSIVITGESGAGKTETAKRMMQFLAHMAGAHVGGQRAGGGAPAAAPDANSPAALHLLLLRTNALMEAWGNARTTMNDNSSRFGKFLAVQYDSSAKLLGAQINTYLLEKTRVVQRGAGEASFHVLYMLLLGLPPSEAGQLELSPDVQHYRYTRLAGAQLDPSGRDGESWAAQLAEVRAVLSDAIGLSAGEVWAALSLLAAVLHCGNIDFATPESGGTSMAAQLDQGAMRPIKALARLLGVEAAKLCDALTTRVIRAGAEWVSKPNTTAEAKDLADALAKALYARLFDHVVSATNAAIGLARRGAAGGAPAHSFIGILDIFGFEVFGTNSLEQLLINYTNEQLQSLFNRIVFSAAQAEAELEGVSTAAFGESQVDNREVLHLFAAERTGLVATLNEECVFPKGTDASFVAKLRRANGKNPRLVDDSSNAKADRDGAFTVRHFAGEVTYTAAGFLLKNKDPFSEDLAVLLRASTEPTVAQLFAPPTAEKSAARRAGAFQKLVFKGVAPQFEAQLQRLLRVLSAGSVHFVRCVKPNGQKRARAFEDERVLAQLRCGGVMEAVRVFAAGYPDRVPFEPVCARYAPLVQLPPKPASADAARALLAALGVGAEQYAVGHSKVFFKGGVVPALERKREMLLAQHALRCQAAVRGMLGRKKARARLAASRESEARRRAAEESERQLAEMEAAASAEREKEAAGTAAAEAAAREAAAEAAAAAAAQVLKARAEEAENAARAVASERKAAEMAAQLQAAQRELAELKASAAAATAAADAGGVGAPSAPPPPPPPAASAASDAEAEALRAAARGAEAEAAALRAQLAKAQDELASERRTAAALRAEAESTNLRWQNEARRANAELRRQTNLREAERRAASDKKDELVTERDWFRQRAQEKWEADAQREAEAKAKGKPPKPIASAVEKAARGAGRNIAAFFGAGSSGGAEVEFSSIAPAGGGAPGSSTRKRRSAAQEVNPTCRRPSELGSAPPSAGAASAAPAARGSKPAPPAAPFRQLRYRASTYGNKWDEETLDYAEYMGIDPKDEETLMWIAEDLRDAPLPPGWVKRRDPTGGLYFHNETTGESMLKHPLDLQYRQLIEESKLQRAMTGAPPPPAAEFGTMTIRSMQDSLFVVPGAETHVCARLAVPGPRAPPPLGAGGASGSLLLPQYVLHTLLNARVVPDRAAESVPMLWASCLQQDANTTLFPLAREADGDDFAWVVAHKGCSRSTLYVQDESAGSGEKEMCGVIVREPYPGAHFAAVDVVLPMPRADGTAVGLPVKRRADSLLAQYEAKQKGALVVLCGQLKADSRFLELTLALPSRPDVPGRADSSMMQIKQSAGGADMELRYRDRVNPMQAMHVALTLSRWWTMRHAARG